MKLYTYKEFVEIVNKLDAKTIKHINEKHLVDVVTIINNNIVYHYNTSYRWAQGIYSQKFCDEKSIKFSFVSGYTDEEA